MGQDANGFPNNLAPLFTRPMAAPQPKTAVEEPRRRLGGQRGVDWRAKSSAATHHPTGRLITSGGERKPGSFFGHALSGKGKRGSRCFTASRQLSPFPVSGERLHHAGGSLRARQDLFCPRPTPTVRSPRVYWVTGGGARQARKYGVRTICVIPPRPVHRRIKSSSVCFSWGGKKKKKTKVNTTRPIET